MNHSYKIVHTEKKDLPFIYHLFEEAIAYQKQKGYPVWKGYDKAVLDQDIRLQRQYKITLGEEIACIFSVCTSDSIVWRHHDVGNAIYLHRIVVNPRHKGHRLVGQIMDWSIEHARQNNLTNIRLDTWGDNPNIIDYYKSFGFEFVEFFTTPHLESLPIQQRGNYVILMEYSLPKKQITEVLHRFVRSFDDKDPKAMSDCLDDQIFADYSSFRKTPPRTIDRQRYVHSRMEAIRHLKTSHQLADFKITLLDDEADISCWFTIERYLPGDDTKHFHSQGIYEFHLVRRSEQWKIDRIIQTVHQTDGDPSVHGAFAKQHARYMVIERFRPGKVKELYRRFEKCGRLLPKGVTHIDSWIDSEVAVCYQLMESESLEALRQWADQWREFADFEFVPVLSSGQAKAKVLRV